MIFVLKDMASQYKLTYFDITGLGESIRLLFHYGGINFVDQRVDYIEDWPALKSSKSALNPVVVCM